MHEVRSDTTTGCACIAFIKDVSSTDVHIAVCFWWRVTATVDAHVAKKYQHASDGLAKEPKFGREFCNSDLQKMLEGLKK